MTTQLIHKTETGHTITVTPDAHGIVVSVDGLDRLLILDTGTNAPESKPPTVFVFENDEETIASEARL